MKYGVNGNVNVTHDNSISTENIDLKNEIDKKINEVHYYQEIIADLIKLLKIKQY